MGSFFSWSIKSGTVLFQSLKHFIPRSKTRPLLVCCISQVLIWYLLGQHSTNLCGSLQFFTWNYFEDSCPLTYSSLKFFMHFLFYFFLSFCCLSLLKLYKDIVLDDYHKNIVIYAKNFWKKWKKEKVIFYFCLHLSCPFSERS